MATLDPVEYVSLPFAVYETLEEKLQALLNGEVLLIKKFEQREGSDVLARLEKKKFTVTQISYDITPTERNPRFWVTFNIGINDLSLFTCFKFEEELFTHTNMFQLNDNVWYTSEDGRKDTALVEEVYVSVTDSTKYAYKLSRDDGLYAEEDLTQNKYE
ncbi:hypothetical protein 043JT007_120 [Bacillus phage 043JT007]|nr:hypothetical protein 043JT007_120 [Bacillus phage 043JT007]